MKFLMVIILLAWSFLFNILAISLLREKIVYSCENGVDIQAALDSGGLRIDN